MASAKRSRSSCFEVLVVIDARSVLLLGVVDPSGSETHYAAD